MSSKIQYFGGGASVQKWTISDCPFPAVDESLCCTFVYSEMSEHWLGKFAFNFDKYLVKDDTTIYGMRDGKTYLLNDGNEINGQDVLAWVLTASSPEQIRDKEFVRIRVNSDNRPNRVDFYTNMGQVASDSPVALIGGSDLKDYRGYEQYIPRRSDNGNRLQGRVMLYKITHQKSGTQFTVIDTEVQYKALK